MSTPQNPLDKYRGFSTHHILLAAHTSETLRNLTLKSPDGEDDQFLDKISEARLGEPIKSSGTTNGLDAYLILDSRKLSNFIIKEIDYQTVFAAGTLNQTQLISSMVNMTVVDASGIAFINYIKYLCDEVFETDYMGLTFLLKTIYVGHTDDNTTEMITSMEIPLILIDMSLSLDHVGGHYALTFAPLNGSVTEAIPSINATDNIGTLKGGTLGEIIDNLQSQLNNKIRLLYNNLNIEITSPPDKGTASTATSDDRGRPVQYMFTLPGDIDGLGTDEKWRDFKMTGVLNALKEQQIETQKETESFVNEEKQHEEQIKEMITQMSKDKKTQAEIDEAVNKKRADRNKYIKNRAENSNKVRIDASSTEDMVHLSLSPRSTIPDILSVIFSLCNEANQKISYDPSKKEKMVSRFKTKTYITSDLKSITAHYDVLEQKIPDVNDESPKTIKDSNKTDGIEKDFTIRDGKRVPKNSLEFDYIFSGKNTDILTFDIKLNNAILFLTNTDKLSEEMRLSAQVGATDQKKQKERIDAAKKNLHYKLQKHSPITAATRTSGEASGHAAVQQGNDARIGSIPGDVVRFKQEALNMLSDLHGVSSQEVKMTIRGNPDLLAKSAYYSNILPHVKITDTQNVNTFGNEAFITTDLEVYKNALKEELINSKVAETFPDKDISLSPLYVKVNIFGPNVNIFGDADPNTEKYAKQYWYDGWYFVKEVGHMFRDGDFTQDISMMAVDMFRRFKTTDNATDLEFDP